jgi:hypothetical protein
MYVCFQYAVFLRRYTENNLRTGCTPCTPWEVLNLSDLVLKKITEAAIQYVQRLASFLTGTVQ